MRQIVQLDGTTLTAAAVERVSTNHADVEISDAAWQRVNIARDVVDGILERGETVY